ncbi:3'-5' exonuclease [Streptomyces sp. BSE6.1]|uniref:3'-5' exonuclease n=1 Tax=Streptomyces sp. BSE6.1 TaxID=2605730 RepID=UPI001F3D5DF9|nr:3'-5' exonuclease [Streptomyces sp. BSE6.1]
MPLTWHRRPLVGVDLATIGSDPETARMTAAAVVRYGGGRDTEVRSWAVTVHDRAPAAAVLEELLDALAARVEAGWPLVICDAPLVLTVLEREAARYGLVPLSVRAEGLCVLDALVLDKEVDKFRRGSRTLESLCQHWRVKLADGAETPDRAKAVCAIVWKLANRHRRLTRPGLPELHRRQTRWAVEQQNERREYLAAIPGREHLADVRHGWPFYAMVPAAKL